MSHDAKWREDFILTKFSCRGRYGGSLALTPDDAPLLLRDTGSQDVYSVDWETK